MKIVFSLAALATLGAASAFGLAYNDHMGQSLNTENISDIEKMTLPKVEEHTKDIAALNTNVSKIDGKLDTIIDNQKEIKGKVDDLEKRKIRWCRQR